jgi:hypothetical protein
VAESSRISKQIKLEYCVDRLSAKKLALAYELLVPDKTWVSGIFKDKAEKVQKDSAHDDGCDLRTSLLGSPERRRYDW